MVAGRVDPRTPVIVGVGQHVQRTARAEDLAAARHPVGLMAEAARGAFADAGVAVPARVDAIHVVRMLSWQYADPAASLAADLGTEARVTGITPHGGNMAQRLVSHAALAISRGEMDVAVLAGGEASQSRHLARRAGATLPWPAAPERADAREGAEGPARIFDDRPMSSDEEIARGIVLPIQVYPMFETAIRARTGRTPAAHDARVAALWAGFSAVAARNPWAWDRTAHGAAEILATAPGNRMVGLPYRRLMNSNDRVDMAAAVVVCSAAAAERMGVARDRWVFPVAGADVHEHWWVSHRWSYDELPAVRIGGARALELAGCGIDDVALLDLYSCFPSAVQLGARALGLDAELEAACAGTGVAGGAAGGAAGGTRELTLTGGLSFAGGPWNDYPMHAIATAVMRLRERPGERALVWANGGFATKHSFGVYAGAPSPRGFAHDAPQDRVDALPSRALASPAEAAGLARGGAATIEAYTVMHARDGAPELAIAAVRLPDGRRAWGTSRDGARCRAMCEGEWVGRAASLDATGTLVD